jgi:hypothetical protein
MTKDKALDLALAALECKDGWGSSIRSQKERAITAIKQARALDKKAENARELGLDYEPVQDVSLIDEGKTAAQPAPSQYGSPELQAMIVARAIEKDRAAQPAPVQEPVAVVGEDKHGPFVDWLGDRSSFYERNPVGTKFYTTPPAQPAVPDAIGPNEDELPAYAAGWNDCRQAMLEMMK